MRFNRYFHLTVFILLIAAFFVVGCGPKEKKVEKKDLDKPTPTVSAKPERPKVNLTEEQKKQVQDLIANGNKLVSENKFFEAIREYDRALEIDPNNIQAYLSKGHLGMRKEVKLHKEAISDFENVVDIDPKNIDGYLGLGRVQIELKDFSASIKAYEKAKELDPKNDRIYSDMGMAYFFMGHSKSALEEKVSAYKKSAENYEKAIEINPDRSGNYFKIIESCLVWLRMTREKEPKEIALKYGDMFKKKFKDAPIKDQIMKKIFQINSIPTK